MSEINEAASDAVDAAPTWTSRGPSRHSMARAVVVAGGLAALLALALNSGRGTPWAATTHTETSAALSTLASPASAEPADRVTMKASAAALAGQRTLARPADLIAVHDSRPTTPEARLMRIYALMSEAHGQQALEEARRLAEDVPTFGLAQLVYADLLSGMTLSTPGFATYPPTMSNATPERLDDLTAEARARITSAGSRPPAGALPSQFVYLAPSVHYAIAVDVSKSRLYLIENTPTGPVLKRDYYASVGKLGISKRTEGDLRTPLGVYFVTGSLAPGKIAERFGAGALPLNYPNRLDQIRGRTGSGIWLHGVEPASFTRAPLATDGCVALSNPDLRELSPLVDRQSTPVVIAESLTWVAASKMPDKQSDFMRRFEAWREARLAKADNLHDKFYSQTVHAAADAASAEAPRPERESAGRPPVSVENLSVLSWHDEDDVMIVTYTEAAKREPQGHVKRQYWMRQAGDWSIIFEGPIS
jgi:murein L,D-transpeptidase YafK